MKEEIKELKRLVYGLAQLTRGLKQLKECTVQVPGEDNILRQLVAHKLLMSSEIHDAYYSLLLAEAWLGVILDNLYEPALDNLPIVNTEHFWDTLRYTEKVDWLIAQINKTVRETVGFSQEYPEIELEQGFVYKYLVEARVWLEADLKRKNYENISTAE